MRCSIGWALASALGGLGIGCGGDDLESAPDESAEETTRGEDTTSAGVDEGSTTAPNDDEGGSTQGTAGGESGGSSGGGSRLGPPYPIVLCHGFFGFEDFAGVDFVNYFFGVVDHLAEHGEVLVFTPAADPFNDSTVRGEQLLAEVEAILARTGHAKVNLVGHSQGGLDARVVASTRPDLVASVTTIATPHQGTPIADIALGLVPNPQAQAVVDALLGLFGGVIWDEIDEGSSLAASLHQLSTPGMAAFNAAYPDAEGVLYHSIGGRTDWHPGGEDCVGRAPPEFVSAFEHELDPVDPALALTEEILDDSIFDPVPNDGLVRVRDAKWGEFLGCVPADHLDEIGHLLGDDPGWAGEWTHLDLYAGVVQLLRDRGL